MHHHANFHQNRSGCGEIAIFPFCKMVAVGHLGLICKTRLWTTREEHLVVSIGVLNLVEIGAEVLMIMQVFVFRSFVLKMPIQAPKIGVLEEFDP